MRFTLPRRIALALALAATGACAAHSFHEHWDAGRYEAAAEDFRTDSTLRGDARALVRMALLQLSPDLPFHDPVAARRNLEAALEMDLEPAARHEAALLLKLAGRLIEFRHQLRALKAIDLERAPGDTTGIP